MPTRGNPLLTVRMGEERRKRFLAAAYNAGTNGSELVNQLIDWWMSEPGAELPAPGAKLPRPDVRPDHD